MALESDVEVPERGGRVRRGGALSLEDCRCPVCLEIFMEPVTLPCTHTFCKVKTRLCSSLVLCSFGLQQDWLTGCVSGLLPGVGG